MLEILKLPQQHLGVNINLLIKSDYYCKSYLYYKSIIDTEKTINILYVDSDYFKLLLKRSENIELNILENNISQNNNDISGFINY